MRSLITKLAVAVLVFLATYGYFFGFSGWFEKFLPIAVLLNVVIIVVSRLKPVEGVTHTGSFRIRRVMNWLPLGLTYAFLYMGRYNIKVAHHSFGDMVNLAGEPLMSNSIFAMLFFWGTFVYGFSFLLNGPLADRLGGKFAIITGAVGASLANLGMAWCTFQIVDDGTYHDFLMKHFALIFSILYMLNMYFQSFGAVAIVKVNSAWFHVKERGVFGAIFGILISLGIYFAYDGSGMLIKNVSLGAAFYVPSALLLIFTALNIFMVKNTPGETTHGDFNTGDASSDDEGPRLPAKQVFLQMMKNPIIITIALVEFCSGFLRQSIMQWFRTFAKQTDAILHLKHTFVYDNWGMLLCCAGILAGVLAGVISDRVFQSRRGPVATLLYALMFLMGLFMCGLYQTAVVGWLVVVMSACIIGVHGMLSGTASMDFGGKKNVGVAVGIIDGFVYMGTAFMSILYAFILPQKQLGLDGKTPIGPATDPSNWLVWPISITIMSLVGIYFARKIWWSHAKDKTLRTEAAAVTS